MKKEEFAYIFGDINEQHIIDVVKAQPATNPSLDTNQTKAVIKENVDKSKLNIKSSPKREKTKKLSKSITNMKEKNLTDEKNLDIMREQEIDKTTSDLMKGQNHIKNILVANNHKRSNKLNILKKQQQWKIIAACILIALLVTATTIIKNNHDNTTISMLDKVQVVLYNNVEYIICGEGETEILSSCGLPTTIDATLAGDHITYLTYLTRQDNTLTPTDILENTKAELFTYAPQPNTNVYIICIDNQYYAAIRHDVEGYHGLPHNKN